MHVQIVRARSPRRWREDLLSNLASEMESLDILEYLGNIEYTWKDDGGKLVCHGCLLHIGQAKRVCPACHRKLTCIFEYVTSGRRIPTELRSVACLRVARTLKIAEKAQPWLLGVPLGALFVFVSVGYERQIKSQMTQWRVSRLKKRLWEAEHQHRVNLPKQLVSCIRHETQKQSR